MLLLALSFLYYFNLNGHTVEPLLSGHHYCKPKVAVQDKWPLIGGHVFFKKKKFQRFDSGGRIRHQECQFLYHRHVFYSKLSAGQAVFNCTSSSVRRVTDAG